MAMSEQVEVDGGTVEAAPEREVVTPNLEDPMELAAMFFTLYNPKFQQLLVQMSNKELRKLAVALIEVPMEEPPNFTSEQGKAALQIGLRLLEAKYMMIMSTLDEHADKMQPETAEEQTATEEVAQTNEGNETNGQ
jgi:hypothetical protein